MDKTFRGDPSDRWERASDPEAGSEEQPRWGSSGLKALKPSPLGGLEAGRLGGWAQWVRTSLTRPEQPATATLCVVSCTRERLRFGMTWEATEEIQVTWCNIHVYNILVNNSMRKGFKADRRWRRGIKKGYCSIQARNDFLLNHHDGFGDGKSD